MPSSIRALAFIDFDNINISARKKGLKEIDFNKLREILLNGYNCVGCSVYLPDKLKSLIPHIQKSGLSVSIVSPNKSVDGRLIFDLLVNAYRNTFDVAIIASGDRDYIPVIEHRKSQGKKVKIASFESALSHGVRFVADEVLLLDDRLTDLSRFKRVYFCPECGKEFTDSHKYFNGYTPKCPDCYSKTKSKDM